MTNNTKLNELILKAKETYQKASELLSRGNYFDAAEKGWCAVELMRKALLVAVGIPLEKAKNLEFSMPIFIRLLRAVGRRDLLKDYYRFDSCLHIRGFYEMLLTEEEIASALQELGIWIKEMENLVKILSKIDLSEIVEMMDKALKIKRKILQTSVEYHEILGHISKIIQQAVSNLVT